MRKSLKRGVAIEYALIVMLIVFAFTAVIVTSSVLSNTTANEYGSYVTQKARVDEIGSLCKIYYVNNDSNALTDIKTAANDYGFTFDYTERDDIVTAADDATVTAKVTDTDSTETLLTMQFIYSTAGSESFTLSAYVYGEI